MKTGLFPPEDGDESENRSLLAVAEAKRRVALDQARRTLARRNPRGPDSAPGVPLYIEDATRMVRVNDVIEKLAADEPQTARLVLLRYFGGLGLEEAAHALHIHGQDARRRWVRFRESLVTELQNE